MGFQCISTLVEELAAIHYPICSCEESKWPRNWVLNVAEVAPLWRVVGSAFPSHQWHMDIHGCDSQPSMCRFWEGWSNVISSGWAVLVYGIVLVPSSCCCMRMKINNQNILHCSAITGLLAAIPANITVFTNFISTFISSHSCRILLFLPFCWFCALVSTLGLWVVFLWWISGKLKKLIRSHECEPSNKIPSFVVIPHFLLSYL